MSSSPLLLFFVDPYPNISPTCEFILVQYDVIIEDNENHVCSSPNISPTCEGIIVQEDPIIEEHENYVFSSPITSSNLEDIVAQEDVIIDTFHSPNDHKKCDIDNDYKLTLDSPSIEGHKKIVKSVKVITTQLTTRNPFIIGFPKSPPIIGPQKPHGHILKF